MRKNIFLVLLLLISVFSTAFYERHTTIIEKQDVKGETVRTPEGRFEIFLKVDKRTEEGDFLSGVKFRLNTYNDTYSKNLSERNDFYSPYYYLEDSEDGSSYFEDAFNTLSPTQKDLVDSINTTKDFKKISSGKYVECNYYDVALGDNGLSVDGSSLASGYYCSVPLPTYLTLEETKVPTGYVKDKTLIPGQIILTYYVPDLANVPLLTATAELPEHANYSNYFDDNENYNVQLAKVSVFNLYSAYSMKYGKVDSDLLVGNDIDEAWNVWETNMDVGQECYYAMNANNFMEYCFEEYSGYVLSGENVEEVASQHGSKPNDLICNAAYVVNQEGSPALTASSTVNNVESITTSVNKNLEYKIVVKNTGDVDSIDNVITTTVPAEFIYVDGTASDDGEYSSGTISWTVPRIAVGEEITLTYTAYAPKGVKEGQDYIGTTTVNSYTLNNKVEANKTKVRLSLQNPNTGAPLYIFVLIIMIAFAVSLVMVQQYTKGKQQAQG